jgi:hypothetical protein
MRKRIIVDPGSEADVGMILDRFTDAIASERLDDFTNACGEIWLEFGINKGELSYRIAQFRNQC